MSHFKTSQNEGVVSKLSFLIFLSFLASCADGSKYKYSSAATSSTTSAASSSNRTFQPAVAAQPPIVVRPAIVVQPAPIVVQPAPIVVQPAPIVVQPAPIVVQPAPIVVQPAPIVVQCWTPEARQGAGADVTGCSSVVGLNLDQLMALIKPQLASSLTISGDSSGSVTDAGTLTGQVGAINCAATVKNYFTPTEVTRGYFTWGPNSIGTLNGTTFNVDAIIQSNLNEKRRIDNFCHPEFGMICTYSLSPALNPGDVIIFHQASLNQIMNGNKDPNFINRGDFSFGTVAADTVFQATRTITYTGKAIPAGILRLLN